MKKRILPAILSLLFVFSACTPKPGNDPSSNVTSDNTTSSGITDTSDPGTEESSNTESGNIDSSEEWTDNNESEEFGDSNGGEEDVNEGYSTSSKSQIVEDVTLEPMTDGVKNLFSVAEADKNIKYNKDVLYYFDFHEVLDTAAAQEVSSKVTRDAVDFLITLQGIVNRDAPRLFINYTDNTSGEPDDFTFANGIYYPTPDKYWWSYLREPGRYLSKYQVVTVKSFGKVVELFKNQIEGVVVWDPEVIATSHVASTVSGVENLLPVRYDTELGLYDWYVRRNKTFEVKRNLVKLFSGSGMIPETNRKSTQSAKCDAYIWALENYSKTGKTNPTLMTYYLDAMPNVGNEYSVVHMTNMHNKDYYIKNKAFFFDLCVWEHIQPTDDLGQPLGTDYKTLTEISTVQNKRAKGDIITIGGFIPFVNKYTASADGSGPGDVASEWRAVRVFSTYYAQLDADAYKGMANGSIYTDIPMKASYSQNANKNPNVKLENKNYIMFYMGDYDSAAMMNSLYPGVWNDPKRGEIPLNWSFNANLKARIPHVFNDMFETKTENDYFVMGDNGAGYLNLESLMDEKRPSGLYGNSESWIKYNQQLNKIFDITVGGYSIFEEPLISRKYLNVIKQYAPDGCALNTLVGDENRVVDGVPFHQAPTAMANNVNVPYAIDFIAQRTNDKSQGPSFSSYRCIWVKPSQIVEIVEGLKQQYPSREYEVVDPYTFKKLYVEFYGGK